MLHLGHIAVCLNVSDLASPAGSRACARAAFAEHVESGLIHTLQQVLLVLFLPAPASGKYSREALGWESSVARHKHQDTPAMQDGPAAPFLLPRLEVNVLCACRLAHAHIGHHRHITLQLHNLSVILAAILK